MSDKLIVKCLTEKNEWEGETWNFLISMTEEQFTELEKLLEVSRGMCEEDGGDFPYSIKKKDYTLESAKILDKEHSDDSGYMPRYQYVGVLSRKLPENLFEKEDSDCFYKGGIKDFCK